MAPMKAILAWLDSAVRLCVGGHEHKSAPAMEDDDVTDEGAEVDIGTCCVSCPRLPMYERERHLCRRSGEHSCNNVTQCDTDLQFCIHGHSRTHYGTLKASPALVTSPFCPPPLSSCFDESSGKRRGYVGFGKAFDVKS